MINIRLGDKEFKVSEARTLEDKRKGLSKVKHLDKDEGMIFYWDTPQDVTMWMKDTLIPLDIIYINEDYEVIMVYKGKPNDENKITVGNTKYVVELNANSGITEGDELELPDDEDGAGPVMKVLNPDGSTLMELWGGERIVSRRETKVLINKAKKAFKSKSDSDYKALGRYMFKVLKGLDNRDPEYVEKPEEKKKEESNVENKEELK